MARSYKNLYTEAKKSLNEKEKELSKLGSKLSGLEVEKTELNNQLTFLQEENRLIKEKKEALDKESREKQKQLDSRELKKLAIAYSEQEDEYKGDVEKWFERTQQAFGILILSTGVSIWLASDKIWYERIEYYLINFIIITFLVFALKQYSYFNKLRIDYANRKTLAQSYQNIISSEENQDIRTMFLQEATNVFCSKSDVQEDSFTMPEKILDAIQSLKRQKS